MANESQKAALAEMLQGKPESWGAAIAMRAALRALPIGLFHFTSQKFALNMFRAAIIFWAFVNRSTLKVYNSLGNAGQKLGSGYPLPDPIKYSVEAMALSVRFGLSMSSDKVIEIISNADMALSVGASAETYASFDCWQAAAEDFAWLDQQTNRDLAARAISRQRLWLRRLGSGWTGAPPEGWREQSRLALEELLKKNESFEIWGSWFERRIEGFNGAFDIPGDSYLKENNRIIGQIVSATNKYFWNNGPEYVNNCIQSWVSDARSRAAPLGDGGVPEAPPQDKSALVYGVGDQGKIERLPVSSQHQLRDIANQRRIYDDVRDALIELQAEGQRLGERLSSAVDRIIHSMPEQFERAEAYLVWRDGNRLRRIYLAHRAVANNREPDPARLEAAIAEHLGGALDLFNVFSLGDDGLRARDEATIPPQERVSGAIEAAIARPVIEAIIASREIADEDSLNDLRASIDDGDLPIDDPYEAQSLDQTNRTWRNFTAAMVTAVRAVVVNGPTFGLKEAGKGVFATMGGTVFTDAVGATNIYWPMIEFVAINAPALSAYAATAFSNYRVDLIIEAALRYFRGK